ncbi:larval cuticle protein 65Ag1-like [Sitodiplosis mosellana]|uniref:larval cuticle protein 65Ag1-like n=1 Tax=Sitodiplosis mosellana TaxID=263140 RepID=UPI0024441E6F|nr:larval cuticle protein 65Ag1-like [Sitodiplosis mosellana]
MMKITFALFVAIVGVAIAFPQGPVITRSEIRDDFGQFGLSYSSEGQAVAQRGALKPIQTPNGLENVLVQQGSYAYYGPDGKLYMVNWVADENGFQPVGDHLPVAPPAPIVPDVPAVSTF